MKKSRYRLKTVIGYDNIISGFRTSKSKKGDKKMTFDKYYPADNEKPLDKLTQNGGFTAIFKDIACVGDSLASGEFAVKDDEGNMSYNDIFYYSWGQFIGRATGSKIYNFSRGGMTAREYFNSFAEEKGFWDPEKRAQCYIIALGVNDASRIRENNMVLGTEDDISDDFENPADTYVGYFSAIVAKYKSISPNSKFFLITTPDSQYDPADDIYDQQRELLYKISEFFSNCYVVDLRKYAPKIDEKFVSHFYLCGHLTPQGYQIFGEIISSYIDYIIRKNPRDFAGVGLVGSFAEDKIKFVK